MSSIPAISPRVIRQAVEWHGLPNPTEVRVSPGFNFPDGRQQNTVYVFFNIQEVIETCNLSHFHETSQYAFKYRLQQCFCEDITVVDVVVPHDGHEFSCALSCVIWKHDHA